MIHNQMFSRFGVSFMVSVADVYHNPEDPNSFCIKWYVECEGQTSPPKTIVVRYGDNDLESIRSDLNNAPNKVFWSIVAKAALATTTIEVSADVANVLLVTMLKRDNRDPECTVSWNTHVRSFNPQAWAATA